MKRHIQAVHEGHKYHKCHSCDISFAQAGHLKTHIHTVHEGHKDHKCEFCGKSFTTSQYLKKHIHTVHQGTKPSPIRSTENNNTKKSELEYQKGGKVHEEKIPKGYGAVKSKRAKKISVQLMTHKGNFHENEIPKNDPKPNATTNKLVSSEKNVTKNNENLLEFQRNNDENEVPPEIDLNKLSQLDLKIIMNKISEKSNYKCQKCTQDFANSLSLEKHNHCSS